ncbi:MAG: DUF4403 family protein [Gemmatimonadetes bacterium]|nr:DUF4403 family protein [Gemmatimonadota bacterium]
MAVLLIGLAWVLWSTPRLDPPAPAAEAEPVWVPELAESTLKVPIRFDLQPVIAALEGAVPRSMGDLDRRIPLEDNDRTDVAYEVRRAPFRASLIQDRAMITSVLSYRARAWYDPPILPEIRGTCGTEAEPLRAVVSASARISLSSDWRLRSEGRVDHVGPLAEGDRDRCRLTDLNIDVTDRVMDAAREALEGHLPEIEAALGRIDLRSRFEGWWRALASPIELTDETWLVIGPVGVHRGPTRGLGDVLIAEIGLSARPRVVFGDRPHFEAPPLPELGSPLEVEGLRIRATGRADYGAASERLTEILAGRTVEQPEGTLTLERVEALGIGGGRVALDVNFGGAARGHIFLVGTPAIDPATNEIHVPDLSFDVDTRSLLIQGYTWIAREEILEFFRERARWPVDHLADFAGTQLERGLNHRLTDDVRLEGGVESVALLGVYPRIDALFVQAEARATASLVIGESDPPS